jgi:hypothetical protein
MTNGETPAQPATQDPGPLDYRTITAAEAKDHQPLHAFSCGTNATLQADDLRAANEVHQALDALYRGEASPQTVVLGEKQDDQTLVAVCCVQEEPIKYPPLMATNIQLPEGQTLQFKPAVLGLPVLEGNGAYIPAIGCQEGYGGHGAGRAILQHAVDVVIPTLWAGRDRPYIHAKILPKNNNSHRMFGAVGFLNLGRQLGGVDAREQDTHLLAVGGRFTLI